MGVAIATANADTESRCAGGLFPLIALFPRTRSGRVASAKTKSIFERD